MQAFAPDYDRLPLIAKVEAFEHALQSTEGNDLARVNLPSKFLSVRTVIYYVYFFKYFGHSPGSLAEK